MKGLTYTHAAQGDLITLYEELTNLTNAVLAATAVESLIARCEDIARYPDMGRRRPDLDALGLQTRSIAQDGRLIVYTRRGPALHIVRILA